MHAPLMGTYYHNMDAKGRMAFPNKLREQLGVNFVITIGLEGCLYVYSNEEWEKNLPNSSAPFQVPLQSSL
ncbi:MAG: MraZ N-terminal domain containing protein [Ruminococcus sp.]|nr:MAG: MraZ N-terminal domain containing protein [Ruminococcus sp.]